MDLRSDVSCLTSHGGRCLFQVLRVAPQTLGHPTHGIQVRPMGRGRRADGFDHELRVALCSADLCVLRRVKLSAQSLRRAPLLRGG